MEVIGVQGAGGDVYGDLCKMKWSFENTSYGYDFGR
jgi:hypothetical protein